MFSTILLGDVNILTTKIQNAPTSGRNLLTVSDRSLSGIVYCMFATFIFNLIY